MRSRGACCGQRNEPNGPSAANDHATAQRESCGLDAVHHYRERLQKSTFGKTDIVRELMQPFGRVHFIALDCAIVGIDPGKLDFLAEVVPALVA